MPTPPNPTQRGRASPSGRVSPQLSPQKAAEWESVFSNRANSEKEPTRLAFGSASPALRDRVNLNEPLMPANDFDDPTPRPSTAEGSTIGGPAAESDLQATIKALLYGLINCIVVTPVMIGFAAIISGIPPSTAIRRYTRSSSSSSSSRPPSTNPPSRPSPLCLSPSAKCRTPASSSFPLSPARSPMR